MLSDETELISWFYYIVEKVSITLTIGLVIFILVSLFVGWLRDK